jgi:hypothetical protein
MAAEAYVEYLAQPENQPGWRPAGWWATCQQCAYQAGPYSYQQAITALDRHLRDYHGDAA